MGAVLNLIQKFKSLNVDDIGSRAASRVKDKAADAQREQLTAGFDSSGNRLRKYKSPAYAKKKNQMNPLPGIDNPDLKLTGSFQNEINAWVAIGKLSIKSTNAIAVYLENSYGRDVIFGLQGSYKSSFISAMRPAFYQEIRKTVRL